MPDRIFEAAPYMKNKCNSMKYVDHTFGEEHLSLVIWCDLY